MARRHRSENSNFRLARAPTPLPENSRRRWTKVEELRRERNNAPVEKRTRGGRVFVPGEISGVQSGLWQERGFSGNKRGHLGDEPSEGNGGSRNGVLQAYRLASPARGLMKDRKDAGIPADCAGFLAEGRSASPGTVPRDAWKGRFLWLVVALKALSRVIFPRGQGCRGGRDLI